MAFQRTTNNYPPFQHTIKNQVFRLTLDFLFFAKVRLEIANILCGVIGNLSEQEWWCQNGKGGATVPNHKRMDLLKNVTNMNLLFLNNKFFILNKVFDILNF